MTKPSFSGAIWEGIPAVLPGKKPYDPGVNHAPKRREVLSAEEKKLAVRNALRYFPPHFHRVLAPEFMEELELYGRIYMYRFRPDYEMKARPLSAYPARSPQAASVLLMLPAVLGPAVALLPHELKK